jgi:Tfp pilus assembly protein PilF
MIRSNLFPAVIVAVAVAVAGCGASARKAPKARDYSARVAASIQQNAGQLKQQFPNAFNVNVTKASCVEQGSTESYLCNATVGVEAQDYTVQFQTVSISASCDNSGNCVWHPT